MVAKLKPARQRQASPPSKPTVKTPLNTKRRDDEDANPKKKRRKQEEFPIEEFDFDEIEEGNFGDDAKRFFEKSGIDDDETAVDLGHNDGRLWMRPDIILDEPQYAGIKSSRKKAWEEEKEEDEEEENDDDDDDDAVGLDSHDEDTWSSDEELAEQKSIGTAYDAVQNEELEALDKEFEELEAEEKEMLLGLRGRNADELLKGRAVSHQKALWDKALEMRILLQKPFSSSNRLPLGDVRSSICESTDVNEAYEKLKASSIATLDSLTDALEVLSTQNPSIVQFIDKAGTLDAREETNYQESPGDIDDIWHKLSSLYSRFIPFRNSSVDRWQRKTQLSTGSAASKAKLRAFNQSISQQVEMHMRDFSRMLQRMWLIPSSIDTIVWISNHDQHNTVTNDDQHNSVTNDGKPCEVNKDNVGDPELIDDTEFYQELLREFLESSDPASVGALYAAKRLHTKKRKVVDRRASKGRKIRYNVHEKIINFMVPLPMNMPAMAEKLFANGLFQGAITHV